MSLVRHQLWARTMNLFLREGRPWQMHKFGIRYVGLAVSIWSKLQEKWRYFSGGRRQRSKMMKRWHTTSYSGWPQTVQLKVRGTTTLQTGSVRTRQYTTKMYIWEVSISARKWLTFAKKQFLTNLMLILLIIWPIIFRGRTGKLRLLVIMSWWHQFRARDTFLLDLTIFRVSIILELGNNLLGLWESHGSCAPLVLSHF